MIIGDEHARFLFGGRAECGGVLVFGGIFFRGGIGCGESLLAQDTFDGKSGNDARAAIEDGDDLQTPGKLPHALAHALDSDAGPFRAEGLRSVGTDFHADTVINDFEGHFFSVRIHADDRGGAIGVAMNIGKAFLHNAEEGDFGFGRQAQQIRGNVHGDTDSGAAFKTLRVPMKRGGQAEFVKQGRVQEIGKSPDLTGNLVGERLAVACDRKDGRIIVQFTEHLREIHGLQGEFLAGDVVQVARDTTAFIVLNAHGVCGEAAEGLGLALFLGNVRDGQEDQIFALVRFDATGVDAHGAGAEMRKVVTDFEIVGALIVLDDVVEQGAEGGDIPLPFAEIVNELAFGFLRGDLEQAAEGGIRRA